MPLIRLDLYTEGVPQRSVATNASRVKQKRKKLLATYDGRTARSRIRGRRPVWPNQSRNSKFDASSVDEQPQPHAVERRRQRHEMTGGLTRAKPQRHVVGGRVVT